MQIKDKYLNNTLNKQKRNKDEIIKYFIIHHTAWKAPWDFNMLSWINKNSWVSVHFYIWKDWIIWNLVWEDYIAYHTWSSNIWPIENTRWWWNLNPISIWVELENLWDWKDQYTKEQIESLERLTLYLVKKYDIKIENILWHKEITTRKIDPSKNFYDWDMEWFREATKKALWIKEDIKENLIKIQEKKKYEDITWYEIFWDMNDNYETKKLIEIWLYRFVQNMKEKKLKIRK